MVGMAAMARSEFRHITFFQPDSWNLCHKYYIVTLVQSHARVVQTLIFLVNYPDTKVSNDNQWYKTTRQLIIYLDNNHQ